MPLLELSAIATLAIAYLDARWCVGKDLGLIFGILKTALNTRLCEKLGKVNVFYVIEDHATKTPDALALVYPRPVSGKKSGDDAFEVERYTFKELYHIILQYAHVLRNVYNVKPDDMVALDCVNKSEFLFVWYALWSIGAKPAFINYNLKDHSLVFCVKAAGAKLFLVDEEIAENVRPIVGDLPDTNVVYLNNAFYDLVQKSPRYRAPDSERNPGDKLWNTAMLIYTSGTTGLPKAAVMSWQKAYVGAAGYAYANRFRNTDIVFSSMPLYHSTASVLGALSSLYIGAGFAVGHKFSVSSYWTQVKLCNATGMQYVGETCRYLLNAPIHPDERAHQLRFAVGNGLRPDVWAKFKERFNIPVIGEFYGGTEFPTATTNYQTGERGIGAVGNYGSFVQTILKLTRFRIAAIDPDNPTEIWRHPNSGLGRMAKAGEPGELVFLIKDPSRLYETFQGYTNDKEATEKKILRSLFKKGDAYVRSGDLLRYDTEGLMYFVDRLGDTFRWKSENVSTNEVEEVISGVDGIGQVVVVGVQVPNHEGRAGFAVVMPSDPTVIPSMKNFATYVLDKLPRYAVPVFVKFVDEIETTGNNKIQKARYRNQKIPCENDDTIYWLKGNDYVPLTKEDWGMVCSGGSKL
jgi:acyl-CoA synthetase (AMP-forming)/AMP-acid ligase II